MKTAFVFSNRAEFAELEPFMKFFASKSKTIQINLSKHVQKIETDENLSKIFKKCYQLFSNKKIDYVCILGDRRELPFIALAAFHLKIKIIHIAAGESIESISSYDQYFRPIVSILSDYQICFSKTAKREVTKLFNGISYLNPNPYVLGNPVFDEINIDKLKKPIKEEYDLVMIHPQSLSRVETEKDIKKLEKKLKNKKTIFIKGNKDQNSDIIEKFYKKILKNKKYLIYDSFPKQKYFAYVKYCDKFYTNTSSVYEIKKINKKSLVIIGNRNKKRSNEIYNKKAPIQLYNLIKKDYNKEKKRGMKK